MKNNKIITYIKENYKLIIPLSLILVVFIAALVYYKVRIYDNYKKDTNDKFYQWFYNKKYEYTGTVSTNRKNEIVDFNTKEYDIEFDSTPIYYQNKNIVIFTRNMSVVMPTLNCSEYLSQKYSYLTTTKNNIHTLTTKKYNSKLGHYFLYDGKDLYFFLDEVKLKIDKQEIKLSPLSYIIAENNKYISYYDKKTDTFKTIETKSNQATAENDYYKIYISIDNIDYYGTDVILTSKISELNPINMKDNK